MTLQFVASSFVSTSAAEVQLGTDDSTSSTRASSSRSESFVSPLTTPTGIVMGFVLGVGELPEFSKDLEAVGFYLQEQLSLPVKMRTFGSDDQLYNWLSRFREVDVAWLSEDFLKSLPVGDVSSLAQSPRPSGLFPSGELVAHPGFDGELRQRISDVFLSMDQTSSGRELLARLEIEHFVASSQRMPSKVAEAVVPAGEPGSPLDEVKGIPMSVFVAGRATQTGRTPESRVLESEDDVELNALVRSPAAEDFVEPLEPASSSRAPDVLIASPPSRDTIDSERVSIGFIVDDCDNLSPSKNMQKFSFYLQEHLSIPVQVRNFCTEDQLYDWLIRFREVDAAWFSKQFLDELPVGEIFSLAENPSPSSVFPYGELVARPGVEDDLRKQISGALLSMEQTAPGRQLLAELEVSRFVPPPHRQPSPERKETVQRDDSGDYLAISDNASHLSESKSSDVSPPLLSSPVPALAETPSMPVTSAGQAEQVVSRPKAQSVELLEQEKLAPANSSSKASSPLRKTDGAGQVLIGFVADDGALVQSSKAEEKIGRYLQAQLSVPIKMRSFDTEAQLYSWLTRFREVDAAWLSKTFLDKLPVGEVFRLAQSSSPSSALPYGELAAHPGADGELRKRIGAALLGMERTSAGRELLAELEISRFVSSSQKEASSEMEELAPLGETEPARAVNTDKSQASEQNEPEAAPAVLLNAVPASVETPSVPVAGAGQTAQDLRTQESVFVEPENVEKTADLEVPTVREDSGESSAPKDSSQSSTIPEISSSAQSVEDSRPVADGLNVPGERSLAGLVGRSEISVLADAEGQFVKSMAINQVLEDEFANQVGETDLQESISAGRSFSRESLAALARVEQAEAQTGQALAQMLPSVTLRANRGYETSEPSVVVDETTGELIDSDKHIRTDTALTIRQPLFDLPIFLDWQRRKVKEQARDEGYRGNDGDAYLSTVSSYLSLVSSRLQADVTRDFEKQLDELLTYIEKRSEAGAASVSDMTRVLARSQATVSSRLELESAHAAAGSEFVRLTNLVPEKVRLPVVEDVGASLLPESFDEAVAVAMKHNPDIAALTAELEAAKIDQHSAKGRYLPRVDAEYTDTYSRGAGGAPSEDDQRDKRLMLVLNWELFSGGNDYNFHLEKVARHKELQYRLDDQRRSVVQALSANYAALTSTRDRIKSGYQELESISIASEAMSKRMLSGNQSLLDLLDVYNQHYQVRARLVSLHTLEMNTVAQLARLTLGTPWAKSERRSSQGE
ncbi:TolC family protein [Deltaproteobacteria bacterium IMCC39524]|nr:TolC family protein [Deltaproteobacteria bacterium IMCC39524]